MGTGGILALSDKHSQWLLVRQTIVSQNLANIDTPGYVARDLRAFDATVQSREVKLAVTDQRHIPVYGSVLSGRGSVDTSNQEVKLSGNSIGLESEMMRMAETHKQFSMNNAIVKLFHKLQIMTLRGSA